MLSKIATIATGKARTFLPPLNPHRPEKANPIEIRNPAAFLRQRYLRGAGEQFRGTHLSDGSQTCPRAIALRSRELGVRRHLSRSPTSPSIPKPNGKHSFCPRAIAPFDLKCDPPLRLYRKSRDDCYQLVVLHEIAGKLRSVEILLQEFRHAYANALKSGKCDRVAARPTYVPRIPPPSQIPTSKHPSPPPIA